MINLGRRISDYEDKKMKSGKLNLMKHESSKSEGQKARLNRMLLKDAKHYLPTLAIFYIWLKKNYINQILFITDIEEAQRVKKEMEKGKRKIYCDLELEMQKDINMHLSRLENNH